MKSNAVEDTLMINSQIWKLFDYIMTPPSGNPVLCLICNHIWRQLRVREHRATAGLKLDSARVHPTGVRARVENCSEELQVERVGVVHQHLGDHLTHARQGAPVLIYGEVSELSHHAEIKKTWDVLDRTT
jgi:hypothetical protein